MSFLEVNAYLGDNYLVPVKDIKSIGIKYGEHGWEIQIDGGDNFKFVECFGKDEDRLNIRYEMIKYLLGVPNEKDILKEIKSKK